MKLKYVLILLGLACSDSLPAQNVGIGTTTPEYKLDVNGTVNGSSNAHFAGAVGIGTTTPEYKLDVNGTVNGTSSAYFAGAVGIGTTTPSYKLQVNDGQVALYNTTDLKSSYWGYSSTSNYSYLSESGTIRMVVANGSNVGIGTPSPTAKLSVAGSTLTTGNATVEGNLTVDDGKGIIRNSGASQLKYYTREAAFGAVLGGHQLSGEGSIGFSSAGFTSAPAIMVGDIVSSGGTVGELYRVQLILYGATATSCKARLLNTSPNPVNYNITWNIICIGQ